jgi:membrane-bound lytic murein transglycosylase B
MERPNEARSSPSGQSLVTAEGIGAATLAFNNCIAELWPEAAQRGLTRANFERYSASVTPDLGILDSLNTKPEFIEPIWD